MPTASPLGAAPGGRRADADDELHPVFVGQIDDLIVFVPGGFGWGIAPVFEVALGVDLDVLPGKLLAQPVETGLGRQLHRLLALGRLDLFVQEDIDAEGVEVGVPYRRVRRQAQPPAQQICAEVRQALDLGEEAFFAGEVEQRGLKRLAGQDYARHQQAGQR